jgi:hypothetical protein
MRSQLETSGQCTFPDRERWKGALAIRTRDLALVKITADLERAPQALTPYFRLAVLASS